MHRKSIASMICGVFLFIAVVGTTLLSAQEARTKLTLSTRVLESGKTKSGVELERKVNII